MGTGNDVTSNDLGEKIVQNCQAVRAGTEGKDI